MMPTAEEFLDADPGITVYKLKEEHPDLYRFIKENLIEFAKLHAQEALKEASNKAKTKSKTVNKGATGYSGYKTKEVLDKKSILNAYPLTNIK